MWKAVLLVCMVFMAAFSSCTRDQTAASLCPGCTDTVSFKINLIPVLTASCAISGCHNAITRAGALNLDSADAYRTLSEHGTDNVTPYEPGNSLFYTLPAAGAMPLNPPPLPQCEIQEIYCWIEQGALNN